MNTTLLQMLITSLIGGTIMVNGVLLKADDLIASAKSATNTANVHQIDTALELYYSDHNAYPQAADASGMIDELYDDGYIRSKPLDETVFKYSTKANGQDYTFTAQ
ncbi:MAG: hypothetical protein HY007_03120 [Candidatus Sungbacteria bacterium]|nr:hypothetical protein [Candidatus Sungbacteria bacterium]